MARNGPEHRASAFKKPVELVPVLRPQLPSADRLLVYLRRIDSSRIYSNWGPLCSEFQNRVCAQLSLPEGGFVSASSGTAALIGAILATAGPAKNKSAYAIMPAFTFVATAVAAERCGYRPYFHDVETESWMLNPEQLEKLPFLDRVGLVIVVAPFGRPVPQAPWAIFRRNTGIPVVIDGAASFDRIGEAPAEFVGAVPVVMSFHATKSFGIGEGGGIAVNDLDLAQRLFQTLNFGFRESRNSECAGLNGKLSEYHAAVGLAELDNWSGKISALRRLADAYRCELEEFDLLGRVMMTPKISSSYALFKCCNTSEVERVLQSLRHAAVDFRLWYGSGVHRHTHYSRCEGGPLPITEDLLQRLIGIPIAPDLTDLELARVTAALVKGVQN